MCKRERKIACVLVGERSCLKAGERECVCVCERGECVSRKESVWGSRDDVSERERHCEYKLKRICVSESVCVSVCMSERKSVCKR